VLTQPQREIFDKVKAFVLEHRKTTPSQSRSAMLSMPNTFPARERKFIGTLAEDLHLSVMWDEYDDDDQNLVVWRFPGALEEPLPEVEGEQVNGDEGEWEDEDEDEDEESRAAVDRVLKKYEKAQVMDDDEGGGFDARYERSLKEKMDEWKRNYYKVCFSVRFPPGGDGADVDDRASLRYRMTTPMKWVIWHSDMWRGCSG
jgi:5'-3' exoribonuclease 1